MGASAASPGNSLLNGAVLALVQFDVCEVIHLDLLQQKLSAHSQQKPSFRPPAPSYVHYQRPQVIEQEEPLVLDSGEYLQCEIKYYDYGVVSVMFHLPFSGGWDSLILLASQWVRHVDFSDHAERIVRPKLARAASALVKPYPRWLSEDYVIFHVRECSEPYTSAELLDKFGPKIAQIVRGDVIPLSDSECEEVLNSRISHYPKDLVVIAWNAALIFDTATGAETAFQILEYANSQLLELRHYDELLTKVLEGAHTSLGQKPGALDRWRLARSAANLQTVVLEVTELTEHADNAIKFLSDMFSARLYKLAAAKVGVPEYKDQVTQKLRTAEQIYNFMVDQFNQSRAFFLEVGIVVLLFTFEIIVFFFFSEKGF